jgi:hypothetical protein
LGNIVSPKNDHGQGRLDLSYWKHDFCHINLEDVNPDCPEPNPFVTKHEKKMFMHKKALPEKRKGLLIRICFLRAL